MIFFKIHFFFIIATNMVLAEPHIHVAMNYRVGALGFMSLPELFAEVFICFKLKFNSFFECFFYLFVIV